MITCPNCRQPNLPGSRLCSQCGASFTGAQGLQHPPPQAPVQPQHPTASSGILPIGHVINNMYRIDGILGEGGMGIVYRATEIASQQPVVVKAIRPEFTDREDFRARILDEGRVVAKIDHQNVVQMRAVFAHESNIFLVLQFVDGESLDKTLARYVEHRKFMPLENVMAIFDQILQGVGAAHEEGVIHRDIKPGNILLQSKNAKAKVTDFGIAKAQYDQRAATKMTMGIIGSPHYISPEQINAVADIDARTDIYSLGIMLFEMLAGRVPFDAPTQYAMMTHHLTSPIPSIRNIRPDVPEHIENVICRACAKDRTQRYASTKEMARAIQYGEAMLRDKTIAGKPVHISGMGPPITDGGAGVAPPPLQPPVFAHPPSGPFQQTPQPVEPFHQQIQQTPQPIQPTPQPQPPYQPHQPPQQPVLHTPQPIQPTSQPQPPYQPHQPPQQPVLHTPHPIQQTPQPQPPIQQPPVLHTPPPTHRPETKTPTPGFDAYTNGLQTTGATINPLVNTNPPEDAKTATPPQNPKKRYIVAIAAAASLVLIGAIVGIATLSKSSTSDNTPTNQRTATIIPSSCQTDETKCGKACCDNAISECVKGVCACKPGTSCGPGKVCNAAHACVDGCLVDGQFFAHGAGNPSNACKMCADSNPIAWTASPKGTRCVTGGSSCDGAGSCVFAPSIAAGDDFTCGVTKQGTVKCWGKNDHGQLGGKNGTTTPRLVDGLSSIAHVAVGHAHACALSTAGAIRCWGLNDKGQVAPFRESVGQNYAAVAAGGYHTCAINSAGGVECWGFNEFGQLGINSTKDSSVQQQVSNLASDVIAISTGVTHTCALKSNGAVLCWGDNEHGRLGVNDETDRHVPTQVNGLETDVIAISAQNGFTCAVKSNGELLCWGENKYGQLGIGSTTKYRVPTRVNVPSAAKISAVSNGDNHACALTSTGALCWGSHESGRLGHKTSGNALLPGQVDAGSVNFTQISSGATHTCAITSDGTAKCWGANKQGQLGIGSTDNKSSPTTVVGFP